MERKKTPYFKWPRRNAEFWRAKIEKNVERDSRKTSELTALGWQVLVVWKCDIKDKPEETLFELANLILSHGKLTGQ